ncbi:hypothetical protein A8F94_16235 [Bacillus sp. FJAT-27225]|nr:hypothetical protein A8F94_16235 [Bacillus sp. FJAT-27225]
MRGLFLLIGFGIAVSGGISVIAYLNLLAAGYTYEEYLSFIMYRPECYLLPIGISIITISIFWPSD